MISRYKNLFKYIELYKPKSILEIGVWNGEHALQMINLAKSFNTPINYYGFDLFEQITQNDILKEKSKVRVFSIKEVRKKLLATKQNIFLFQGYTQDTLRKFCKLSKPFIDFAFIDGGHSLETIDNDWFYVKRLIHKSSTVIFDDYYNEEYSTKHGCRQLIENERKIGMFNIEILEPKDIIDDREINMVLVQPI